MKTKFLNLLLLCMVLNGCSEYEKKHNKVIWLFNQSQENIYVDASFSYPDTTCSNLIGNMVNPIKPNELSKGALWIRSNWPIQFISSIPSDTLIVFIFADNFDSVYDVYHVPSNILEENILQRYDLSLADLQMLDWILYYPPNEAMKNIKMWPPYGEVSDNAK